VLQGDDWLAAAAATAARVGSKSTVSGPEVRVLMCVIPEAVGLRQTPLESDDQYGL
jgi:hypothetical protein